MTQPGRRAEARGGKNVECAALISVRSTLFPDGGKNVACDSWESADSTNFPGATKWVGVKSRRYGVLRITTDLVSV